MTRPICYRVDRQRRRVLLDFKSRKSVEDMFVASGVLNQMGNKERYDCPNRAGAAVLGLVGNRMWISVWRDNRFKSPTLQTIHSVALCLPQTYLPRFGAGGPPPPPTITHCTNLPGKWIVYRTVFATYE